MTAEDFVALVSLGPFSTRIPVDDVAARIEHEDCVIRDAFHQQPEPSLGVFQFRSASGQFCSALFNSPFQSLI